MGSHLGESREVFFCQATTDAVRFIQAQYGFQVWNYSDDILSCLVVLQDLGLPISERKFEAPRRELTCLGIVFDVSSANLHSKCQLLEIIDLCSEWSHKTVDRSYTVSTGARGAFGFDGHIFGCPGPPRAAVDTFCTALLFDY